MTGFVSVRTAVALALLALSATASTGASAQVRATCAATDSAAGVAIRARLREWVAQANRGDRVAMQEIWAPGLVGWFPSAPIFGDSAAYAVAGIPYRASATGAQVSYELTIEEVAASGPIAAVHDLWLETRRLPGAAFPVRRLSLSWEIA